MNGPYENLEEALLAAAAARQVIAENRGYEREQARDSYETCISEVLMPAIDEAYALAVGDLDPKEIEMHARDLMRRIERWRKR